MKFRECFSREATFKWFAIVIIGLMVRNDHLGVTSIIRELGINPNHYESMLHFFRSSSWKLSKLIRTWTKIVATSGLVHRAYEKPLLLGDGVDQSKEGRKMPGVKNAVAQQIGESCRIALDRYYLTVNALATLDQFGNKGFSNPMLSIITKAKKNAVRKGGRGQPRKKGATIKLSDLFHTKADAFRKAKVNIYGKVEEVELFVTDLLWGKKTLP